MNELTNSIEVEVEKDRVLKVGAIVSFPIFMISMAFIFIAIFSPPDEPKKEETTK